MGCKDCYSEYMIFSTSNGQERSYKVYLITMDKMDQYWEVLSQGASDMADVTGIVEFIWEAPDTKDTNRQIEIINEAVIDRADLLMVAAIDPIAISGAIEDAKSQGVKIIYVDSPAYEEAIVTLSTNNRHAGVAAGRIMIDNLEAEGITEGSIGLIGMNNVTLTTLDREEGFREAIEEDGRFYVPPTQYEEGNPDSSKEAALRLIAENPDMVGLYGVNEGSTSGVGNAIMQSSKNIIGVGFDASEGNLELLSRGYLKAIMAQNPFTMGYLGMAEAVAALLGLNTGPLLIDTGISVITL